MEAIKLLERPLSPTDTITINNALKEARQEGRREVVRWITTNSQHIPKEHKRVFPDWQWQAKLKEWGI